MCQDALPYGDDLSWWAILGMIAGIWPGFIWTPGGYAHSRCWAWYGDVVRKRDCAWLR